MDISEGEIHESLATITYANLFLDGYSKIAFVVVVVVVLPKGSIFACRHKNIALWNQNNILSSIN